MITIGLDKCRVLRVFSLFCTRFLCRRWRLHQHACYAQKYKRAYVTYLIVTAAGASFPWIRAPIAKTVTNRGWFSLKVKNAQAGLTSPSPCNMYVSQFQAPVSQFQAPVSKFEDPSEPIYTDPSLFERSRSLRSLTVCNVGKLKGDFD